MSYSKLKRARQKLATAQELVWDAFNHVEGLGTDVSNKPRAAACAVSEALASIDIEIKKRAK